MPSNTIICGEFSELFGVWKHKKSAAIKVQNLENAEMRLVHSAYGTLCDWRCARSLSNPQEITDTFALFSV